jgi:hypothetical protein
MAKKEFDITKLRSVGSGNMQKAEGFQPSVWDVFKDDFPNPGDFKEWPKDTEDGLTSGQASQIATRLRILHPGTYFHSGVITTKTPNTVFVRRREEGWLPTSEKKKLEEAKAAEGLPGSEITEEKLEQPSLPGSEDNEE